MCGLPLCQEDTVVETYRLSSSHSEGKKIKKVVNKKLYRKNIAPFNCFLSFDLLLWLIR